MKAIPSNLQTFQRVVCAHIGASKEALILIDALVASLQPPNTVLCACNHAWIHLYHGKPQGADGHGWDDCTANRRNER